LAVRARSSPSASLDATAAAQRQHERAATPSSPRLSLPSLISLQACPSSIRATRSSASSSSAATSRVSARAAAAGRPEGLLLRLRARGRTDKLADSADDGPGPLASLQDPPSPIAQRLEGSGLGGELVHLGGPSAHRRERQQGRIEARGPWPSPPRPSGRGSCCWLSLKLASAVDALA
jgi:hypothetical protein